LTPGAKLLSISNILKEVLDSIVCSNTPPDKILITWFRKNRYAGSKDRKEISDSVYGMLRRYFILNKIIINKLSSYNYDKCVQLVIIYYILFKDNQKKIIEYFDDGPYSLKKPDKIESYIEDVKNIDISQDLFNFSMPNWLYDEFLCSYRDKTKDISDSLLHPSNIDLRVSRYSNRDEVLNKLLRYDPAAIKTPYSSLGIRLSKRILLNNIIELNNEFIEIQDEGSQLVTLLSGIKDNELVIDLCAGVGGKSLFLAELAKNVKIIATDIDPERLNKIKNRPSWKKNIHKIDLDYEYNNIDIKADRVICDVPCSGSGAWRRRPEEKIRLTKNKFKELLVIQNNIIKKGASLLKVGGELVYITCSLIKKENYDQIELFLKNNSLFEIVDLNYSWNNMIKSKVWMNDNSYIQLLPNIHKCDGFFIARLRKNK